MSRISTRLARPFRALGGLVVLLGSAGASVEAIRRLTATSDRALAERGTTRGQEIRRIVDVWPAA